jgi:hypothetical protein
MFLFSLESLPHLHFFSLYPRQRSPLLLVKVSYAKCQTRFVSSICMWLSVSPVCHVILSAHIGGRIWVRGVLPYPHGEQVGSLVGLSFLRLVIP